MMENPNNIPEKLLKPYAPNETEKRMYSTWESSGFFNPDVCIEKGVTAPDAEPFSIVLPPPNVTGTLHMGHALGATIQDIAIRYARMQGKKTLWIPGTDHAAIATQSKVEKDIQKKEGLSRHDLGREELLKRVTKFAQESHDTIVTQLRVTGASLDWSREAYTLDEHRNFAVRTLFKKMYDDRLIYRGHRVVNWDPKGQTTIADDEIVHEERTAKMYTFKYSKDFPISISTTRPETKIGDTAVAVSPNDERYAEFIGKEYDAVFCGVPIHIKIVADESVEKEFGTGALGVTPAHSQIDAEIAQRHNLPTVQVINEFAKMMIGGENLMGKKTTEAREVIAQWLRDEGLMEKEEEITQNISTAERTGGIIEPLPKLQWFIDVEKPFTMEKSTFKEITVGSQTTLKEIMRVAVSGHYVNILPENFNKTYFHWIDNLRPWCISRQIWYGHRIPVWYKDSEIYCGIEAPEGEDWTQDEDTLDTWFSSGLWTFSTLGWPNKTADLETYHPNTLLVPAYEILFFWVARMILMTGYALGTHPFDSVYLTGIVRDAQGRKFSKSLGNGIDPLVIADKYGMDAGRMALIVGTTPGTDLKIDENKIKAYSKFANKLWNITRFVFENRHALGVVPDLIRDPLNTPILPEDQKNIDELDALIKEVTKEMDEFKFYLVADKLYHYAWDTFASRIIEETKKKIAEGTDAEKTSALATNHYLLTTILRALHPFMPFITEEIWGLLPENNGKLLMVEKWPCKQ